MTIAGIPLAPGIATGTALTVSAARSARSPAGVPGTARERLAEARARAQLELTSALDGVPDGPARQILRAHLALLDDPLLLAQIEAGVETGLCAEDALDQASSILSARFAALRDPLLRARAADLCDVCECIAHHLAGNARRTEHTVTGVVCAKELSPAQVLRLIDRPPLAVALETAVETSHAAILIRSLGVPAVIGLAGLTAAVGEGDVLFVNGVDGHVVVNPEPAALTALASAGWSTSSLPFTPNPAPPDGDSEPACTVDGSAVAITATVIDAADARRAFAAGADGIGLFRTEWLYLRTGALPSEERQYDAYREVATLAGDRPVTMRTIDLGSDKSPPALALSRERNPALGLRGVALALAHPELMKTQFRALFRAFDGRRLRLLLPMVNDPDDVDRMRALLDDAVPARGAFEMGVMIETPAAALMAGELAAAVDFLSLGTNDLTQYVLAADRENSSTAARHNTLHPAVLRIVSQVMTAARRYGTPVAVCGEAASDPIAARLLVGLGVTELSVLPLGIAASKRLIRRVSVQAARVLAEELMALPTAAAVALRVAELSGLEG
jgi:multiphosphoryl transfer protein